jgi:HK97 gp10 family phage protein
LASIKIQGLGKLIKRIDDYPVKVQKVVDLEIKAGATKIRDLAVQFAPVDQGVLRRDITADVAQPFKASVKALAFYSPYVEWGTGRKVNVPGDAERKRYALTFKGTKQVQGQRPQPFFFRAYDIVKIEILKNIKRAISKA